VKHGVGDFYVTPLSILSYVETDTVNVKIFLFLNKSANEKFFYSFYIFSSDLDRIRYKIVHKNLLSRCEFS